MSLPIYQVDAFTDRRFGARQLSERGGELTCTLKANRVLIAGRTVEYLRGEIDID